jgi:hypothetical protein
MTLTACALQWAPDTFNWASSAATDVGLRLHEAFAAFAAAVNPTPANADHQLTSLRNHASATGSTSYGFAWRLGHPVNPLVLSFHNVSLVQGSSASSSSALLRLGLASAYVDDTSNGGYGAFSATLLSGNRGLSHYGPTGSPVVSGLEGALVVAFEDTPGQEFFLATIARIGADTYSLNFVVLLFRSPATSGWNLWVSRARAYIGMSATNDRWSWRGDTPESVVPLYGNTGNQQLNAPLSWWINPQDTGPVVWNTAVPRLLLPPLLWGGDNQYTDVRRLGRFTDPAGGGTFYQLGSAGGFGDDLWMRLPTSPAPVVLSGWSTVGSLPWLTFPDRLAVMAHPVLAPALVGPSSSPDFLTDWTATAAGIGGIGQHPLYVNQLPLGGAGGGSRPASGVLWPRRA